MNVKTFSETGMFTLGYGIPKEIFARLDERVNDWVNCSGKVMSSNDQKIRDEIGDIRDVKIEISHSVHETGLRECIGEEPGPKKMLFVAMAVVAYEK